VEICTAIVFRTRFFCDFAYVIGFDVCLQFYLVARHALSLHTVIYCVPVANLTGLNLVSPAESL
jgi:hypothetical protein